MYIEKIYAEIESLKSENPGSLTSTNFMQLKKLIDIEFIDEENSAKKEEILLLICDAFCKQINLCDFEYEQKESLENAAQAYMCLIKYYMDNARYDDALAKCCEALEVSKQIPRRVQACKYVEQEADFTELLASIYEAKNNYNKAEEFYIAATDIRKALSDFIPLDNTLKTAEAYRNLSEFYSRAGKKLKAIGSMNKSTMIKKRYEYLFGKN